MNHGREIISLVAQRQDLDQFRRKNWEGTFEEYLDIVRSQPRVTRNAFERIYDMILSYGTEDYEEVREKRIRYRFFSDPENHGHDAVFADKPHDVAKESTEPQSKIGNTKANRCPSDPENHSERHELRSHEHQSDRCASRLFRTPCQQRTYDLTPSVPEICFRS